MASLLRGLVWELRPWQWYKQAVVLLGLLFSESLFDPTAVLDTGLAVVAFCLVSGSVYVFNDISDLEADRNHPEKKHRPIASGVVPIWVAVPFALGVGAAGLLTAAAINHLVLLAIGAYVLNNAIYNVGVKDLLFIDVFSIAVGFVLRALAGAYAVQEAISFPSPWLITCTFLAALMLGFGKRYREHEMSAAKQTRSSLEAYDAEVLDRILVAVTAALIMSYSLYTVLGTNQLMLSTLPFALFATFRFHHLLSETSNRQSIERMLFGDRQFLTNVLLWGTVVVTVLYADWGSGRVLT